MKRLELAAQVAQKEHEKARLNYLPRVRVIAEYDVDQRRLFGNSGDSYTIIAVMNFNLFNGFADLAKVRESRAQKKQAEEQYVPEVRTKRKRGDLYGIGTKTSTEKQKNVIAE